MISSSEVLFTESAGQGPSLAANTVGNIAVINITISNTVTAGTSIALNLASNDGFTTLADNNLNVIPLDPAPTDAANDAGVDGTLIIQAAAPPALLLNAPSAGYSTTFYQLGGPVSIVGSSTLTVSDTSSTTLQSATVTILNPQDGTNEILAATTTGTNITASYSNDVLTLSGTDTLANYQQVLRTVTYNDTVTNALGTNTRAVTFVVNDGISNSATVASVVSMRLHADQPPVIEFPTTLPTVLFNPAAVSGLHTATANTETFTGANAITVADSDANLGASPGIETVTLTVTGTYGGTGTTPATGILNLAPLSGLTVTGNGSAVLTISGTLANLNAALATLVYTPGAGFFGTATVTVLANDDGSSGYTGGLSGLTTSANVNVTVVGCTSSR